LGLFKPLGTSKPQLFCIDKIQAFALDAHFTLEQVGRNSKLHFSILTEPCMEKNVSWMRWESDTLTEDLDLSYRAQLKLEFKYLENVVTLITSLYEDLKFRWNKGGAEISVKCDCNKIY
jgi:hypothetical protein